MRFSILVSESPVAPGRRGLLGRAIRVFLLKVAGALVDRALPKLDDPMVQIPLFRIHA